MAVLHSCLCCSLLTASLTIAIMSAFLYGLAFALELYMLVETSTSLSVPAYILTIGYQQKEECAMPPTSTLMKLRRVSTAVRLYSTSGS